MCRVLSRNTHAREREDVNCAANDDALFSLSHSHTLTMYHYRVIEETPPPPPDACNAAATSCAFLSLSFAHLEC